MSQTVLQRTALLCLAAAITLTVVTFTVDLDQAVKWASIAGSIAALLGCALSFYLASRAGQSGGAHSVRVRGPGAIAATGPVIGNATGKKSRVTRKTAAPAAPAPTPAPPGGTQQHQMDVRGPGAVGSTGEVSGNATGKGSAVEET